MPAKALTARVAVLLGMGAIVSLACGASEPALPPATPPPEAAETATPATEATPSATAPAATEAPAVQAPDEDEAALAAELAEVALAPVIEEFGESAEELTAHAFPLGLRNPEGALWAVVTNGPQPFLREGDGNVINFFHFVALYRRNADVSWSEELYRVTLETAPQRTHTVEVLDPGPRRAAGPGALIAIRGQTGAHAGTFDVLLAEGELLRTTVSHISAGPDSGAIADLDGDGVAELIFNTSNPYVFCYACAVEERSEQVYRWTGLAYEQALIETPDDLESDLASRADTVVRLAEANLWRDAAALAIETSRRAPDHEGLRWLSIVVNRTAVLRLAYAGSPGQPLLTNVLAGEYGAAFALMQALPPEEAFALDGPLIGGTAAESDLPAMVSYLLFHADEALKARDDDPAIHAVRALGQVLASPDDLSRARSSIGRALRLSPDDPFLQQAKAYLDSIEVAPGLPPDDPDQ